ncbi:MAG: hypothetical protein OSB32_04300 [Candidatus Poseidoniales archaeon]|nr:hypothetical protein [Candidatus Poseidoniales archaeon]
MVFGLRDKVLIGVGLTFLLLNLTLLPIVFTGAVPAAVDEKFETYPLDAACGEEGDCSTVEADWATSTAQRDYYAWDVTNLADVMAIGATPTYQKMGPFTYDITSTKTLIEHDEDAGELTYNLVKSFDCAANSAMPCDTEITQLNIQFRPQIIGATGTAFNGIMDLTKIGFASAVMNQDLNTTQAGIATAQYITSVTNVGGGYGYANYGAAALGTAEGMGKVCVIMCNIADGNPLPAPDWSEGIDAALYSTTHPLDSEFNISMRDSLGPVAFMGMGTPEFLVSDILADPANSTTVYRATAYGYMATMMIDTDGDDIVDTEVPDYPQTLIRDWCLYVLTGSEFQENGGGSDFTDSEDIGERLDHLLDVDFSDVDNLNLMLNGDGTDTPLGLLAENADGTGFGLAAFLNMDGATAMSTYGLDQIQYDAIFTWADGWATSSTSMQLALIGGTGTVNAGQFVNTTFGAEDPINGGYLERSLNLGGLWETMYALPAVNLTPEQSANVLYGPLGLTTRTGANLFLYGELVGNTPPVDLATLQPAESVAWNTNTIAALYDIDTNAASAMRTLVTGPIFENFVPDYLMDKFGTTPYLTQSVNNWLYGWHDPVSAYLESGDAEDMSVGWASLEANATYYGSNGVPNGDGTNYTICTGENPTCDKGEMIEQDGSTQLSWRNDAMMAATLGIITPEELSGATGGFIVGEGDKVDVSGYAIADLDCSGTSSVKNIPVDVCTASVEPTNRLIQAKLLKTFTLLDATPSALPVYLGSDIEVKSEQLSGLIIAGESTTTFYLDTRDGNDMVTPPAMDDMVPVFQIQSASIIGDEDAEQMESAIVQNQNYFTFWSNFDTGLDFIPLFLWIFGISLLICPAIIRLFD